MTSDSIVVAISGVKGTNHFKLSKSTLVRLKFLAFFLCFAVIGVTGTIYFLMDEVNLFKQKHNLLEQKSVLLSQELKEFEVLKTDLQHEVTQKQQELEYLSDRLKDIETVVGSSPEALDINSRLDVAAINTVVRQHILQIIPSGSPVNKARISSPFGMRTHPVTKKRIMHRGLDFAVNTGTPIYAPADGVIEVTRKSNQGSGNYLRVSHAYGITSSYSHLKSFKVQNGDFVKKGDLIAISGNTGMSAGPHLHYEVRFVGRALDPKPFVNWSMENFESVFNVSKGIKWDYLIKNVENQVNTTIQLSSQREQKSPES
ncbi:M23 family metallopeptidase [Vibrio hannami]|uniref:M23 family metallopeptidase n=1 Tax=Vibrio hannami TaxID=2717094 RepID=UPI0024107B67|nr:M23 family metallopeptidase [Vibrio hannami]MDG3088062.1 M23 family metallopeptidase [Vibrio hannami]